MIHHLIWKQLYRVNVRSIYLEKLLKRNEATDRYINMFLAIASSSSIAGWALWNKYVYVWTTIIALSQVINAILPYLPYKERIKSLSGLARDLRQLGIMIERTWLDIAAGDLPEAKMRSLYYDYLKNEAEYEEKYFSGKSIPENMKLFVQAEDEAKRYLSSYNTNGDQNDGQEENN
ncbi:hypothetical protein [Candidatus Electronema sp. PJ]|jgi:hypothetical protein|uniref:hypothetical protein n=1 Tax=Candidatus Electronema sp. PJ TaxID=3401572 RepID=UPI003AA883EB